MRSCYDEACFQFFADLHVFVSKAHISRLFSGTKEMQIRFLPEPLCNGRVWPQGGTPAMLNRGLHQAAPSSLCRLLSTRSSRLRAPNSWPGAKGINSPKIRQRKPTEESEDLLADTDSMVVPLLRNCTYLLIYNLEHSLGGYF